MRTTKFSKILDKFQLPTTRVIYDSLGVPEPEAWKFVVLSCLPLGCILAPSFFFDPSWLPALEFYGHPVLSSMIGLLFLVGSSFVLYAWWGKSGTQSQRVLREIKGNVFLAGAFLSVFFCGLPSFPHVIFVFFGCIGVALGCLDRSYQLVKNHFKLVKIESDIV